ncbi:MAG: OB-fold protein [Bacteroidia bacterium]
MKLRIILAIIILGAIGVIANYMWNKPPRNIAAAKEDFILSASDFNKEYTIDENAANTKYLEKVIAVKGTVFEIQLENEDEPTVALATDEEGTTILCGFKKELLPEVKKLNPGDKIKVKGKCDGKGMFGIVITQCSLIK